MEEFWKCVFAKHQEFPFRPTVVSAGDFNGDVMPDAHDPLIGRLHPAKKGSDNGAHTWKSNNKSITIHGWPWESMNETINVINLSYSGSFLFYVVI